MGLFNDGINFANRAIKSGPVKDALDLGHYTTDINAAFDGGGENFFLIPDKRVLSSKARIRLQTPGLDGAANTTVYVGEMDNFTAAVNFEVTKQFKPYGHTKTKTLTRHGGWNLSMSGGKVHWALSYVIYMNERFLLGETSNKSGISQGNTFAGQLVIGNSLIFDLEEKVTYYDGTDQIYIYKDVTLLNYSMEIAGNNVEIPETVTAFAPERIIGDEFSDAVTKMTGKGTDIVTLMQKINKS